MNCGCGQEAAPREGLSQREFIPSGIIPWEQELTESRIPEGHFCLGSAPSRQGAQWEDRRCWIRLGADRACGEWD